MHTSHRLSMAMADLWASYNSTVASSKSSPQNVACMYLGRSKLRWATSDVLSRKRQICVAIPLAPRSVRVKAADLDSYTRRDALRVRFQTARYDSAAPWSGRGCKSAWLQQYRQACKLRLAARAEAGWSGGAVLTIARAHPSELASPLPPAQCTAVHARAMPLVHIAA